MGRLQAKQPIFITMYLIRGLCVIQASEASEVTFFVLLFITR